MLYIQNNILLLIKHKPRYIKQKCVVKCKGSCRVSLCTVWYTHSHLGGAIVTTMKMCVKWGSPVYHIIAYVCAEQLFQLEMELLQFKFSHKNDVTPQNFGVIFSKMFCIKVKGYWTCGTLEKSIPEIRKRLHTHGSRVVSLA